MTIVYIIILFFVCLMFFKPGFKFFLFWLAVCGVVFCLLDPSAGVWGVIVYTFVLGNDEPSCGSSSSDYTYDKNYPTDTNCSGEMNNRYTHRGTSYREGNLTRYSNGNSSVRYGDVTYFNGGVRSVQSGSVTYYFDCNDRELGRSVDNGNGVHTYFDVNNNEIGHSYTSGRITDFIGDCFESSSFTK